jgi:hypothetical protein
MEDVPLPDLPATVKYDLLKVNRNELPICIVITLPDAFFHTYDWSGADPMARLSEMLGKSLAGEARVAEVLYLPHDVKIRIEKAT